MHAAILVMLVAQILAAHRPADPFPLRRVETTLDKLPAESLRRLPLADFEMLVRTAAYRQASQPPRLVSANYRATFTGRGLVGTATLVVAGRGALPLDGFKPAIRSAKWADGRAAILYPPQTLWADGDTATLDWSQRGTEEPGEVRFDLRLPPAPLATLDLDLPAGRVPVLAQADVLLTGPSAAGERQTWRIRCGGRSRIEFAVRDPDRGGLPGPLVRGGRLARFEFAPGTATGTFEFDLESVRGPIRAFAFAVDPRLTVTAVAAPALAGWQQTGTTLTVDLREPAAALRMTVQASTAFPADGQPWTCPVVVPLNAAAGPESVELRFGPDVRANGWDAGDYRVTTAAATADRGYSLMLVGSLATGATRRLPTVRVVLAGAEYSTAEEAEWRVGPGGSRLLWKLKVNVGRGPVTRLPVRLPAGYQPAAGPVIAADPAAAWATGPNGTWLLEPGKPWATGQVVEVSAAFRGPPGPPPADPGLPPTRASIPYPAFGPTAATARTGTLALLPDATYQTAADDTRRIAYSGREPEGMLTLTPRPVRAMVERQSSATLAGGRTVTTFRISARATANAGSFTVVAAGGWEWTATSTDPLVGIPWVPAANGWAAIADTTTGPIWQLRLPQGGRASAELTFTAAGAANPPPPVVLGCDESTVRRPIAVFASEASSFVVEDLLAVTHVLPDGRVVGTLSGRVRAVGGPVLPIRLPDGAEVESATVGGKWADATTEAIPIPPPGPGGTAFDIRYRLPTPITGIVAELAPEWPSVPGGPAVRRLVKVGPRYGVWPDLASETEDDRPQLLLGRRAAEVGGWAIAAGFAALAVVWLAAGPPRRVWLFALLLPAAVFGAMAAVGPVGWRPAATPAAVGACAAILVGATLGRKVSATVVLLAAGSAVAQAPTPATVYVVPGKPAVAFVAPAVLDRLTALAASPLPAVVMTSAEYDATADGSTVNVTARFAIHINQRGPHAIALPLAGVRLGRVTFDGKPAFPELVAEDRFAVQVEGVGPHELTATFAVPATAVGADREMRFVGPDLAQSRLRFDPGANGRQVTVPVRRGDLVPGPPAIADLGGGTVQVRWREGGPAAGEQAVSASEVVVWDLDDDEATATAAVRFKVERGSIARLRFAIPPGLEPGPVTVRTPDASVGVRDWAIVPAADGWRELVVGLQTPADGTLVAVLRLHPTTAAGSQPTLTVPRAVGVTSTDTFVGVRWSRVGVTVDAKEAVIDFTPDPILRDFGSVPELALDRRPLNRAFRRTDGGTPRVRLTVQPLADAGSVAHDLTWTIGSRVEVAGVVKWKETGAVPGFDVPAAVKLGDVSGTNVDGWERVGNRVRVWFRGAVKEPTVTWTGTLTGFTGDLPTVPGTTAQTRAAAGWVLATVGGKVRAFPSVQPVVRVGETFDPTGPQIEYRAAVELDLPAGRPHEIGLSLSPVPSDTRLEVPSGTGVTDTVVPGGRTWTVTIPASAAQPVRLAVVGRLPHGPTVALPVVDVRAAGMPASSFTPTRSGLGTRYSVLDGNLVVPPTPPAIAQPTAPNPLTATVKDVDGWSFVGWVAGLAAVGALLVVAPRRVWPEAVAGFGLAVAAAVGAVFLPVVAVGVVARGVRVGRWAKRVLMR